MLEPSSLRSFRSYLKVLTACGVVVSHRTASWSRELLDAHEVIDGSRYGIIAGDGETPGLRHACAQRVEGNTWKCSFISVKAYLTRLPVRCFRVRPTHFVLSSETREP